MKSRWAFKAVGPQYHLVLFENRLVPEKRKAGQICPAFAVTRFIRLHPGVQKGGATNLWSTVRAAPRAKPLCQLCMRTAKSLFLMSIKTQFFSTRSKMVFRIDDFLRMGSTAAPGCCLPRPRSEHFSTGTETKGGSPRSCANDEGVVGCTRGGCALRIASGNEDRIQRILWLGRW